MNITTRRRLPIAMLPSHWSARLMYLNVTSRTAMSANWRRQRHAVSSFRGCSPLPSTSPVRSIPTALGPLVRTEGTAGRSNVDKRGKPSSVPKAYGPRSVLRKGKRLVVSKLCGLGRHRISPREACAGFRGSVGQFAAPCGVPRSDVPSFDLYEGEDDSVESPC